MPRKHTETISTQIPKEWLRFVERRAKFKGHRSTTEYLRALIEADLGVEFQVRWGGKREKTKRTP